MFSICNVHANTYQRRINDMVYFHFFNFLYKTNIDRDFQITPISTKNIFLRSERLGRLVALIIGTRSILETSFHTCHIHRHTEYASLMYSILQAIVQTHKDSHGHTNVTNYTHTNTHVLISITIGSHWFPFAL